MMPQKQSGGSPADPLYSARNNSPPHKILIVRTDRLGDVILSTPVAVALKKHLPASQITFLVRHYTQPVVEASPSVDAVILLENFLKKNGALRQLALSRFLKKQKFDVVIHLHPRPEIALATSLAGIPIRIGTGYRLYSFLFNRRQYEHRKNAARHEAEYNLRMLQHLGISEPTVAFDLAIDKMLERQVDDLLRSHGVAPGQPFVVLHPGSGGSARDWPLASFAQLADKIGAEQRVTVLITGSAAEKTKVQRLRDMTRTKPPSLAGRLSIEMLAALLQRAHVFIGNSSGPLHLAVAMGTQVVAFYPPITPCRPERWGPYGHRDDVLMSRQVECFACAKQITNLECACMQAISVDQTYQKVIEKIALRRRSKATH